MRRFIAYVMLSSHVLGQGSLYASAALSPSEISHVVGKSPSTSSYLADKRDECGSLARSVSAPSTARDDRGLMMRRLEELHVRNEVLLQEKQACMDANSELIARLDAFVRANAVEAQTLESAQIRRRDEALQKLRERYDRSESQKSHLSQENGQLQLALESERRARAQETQGHREHVQELTGHIQRATKEKVAAVLQKDALERRAREAEHERDLAREESRQLERRLDELSQAPARSDAQAAYIDRQANRIRSLEEALDASRQHLNDVQAGGSVQVQRNRELTRDNDTLRAENAQLQVEAQDLRAQVAALIPSSIPTGESIADELADIGASLASPLHPSSSAPTPVIREAASTDAIDPTAIMQARHIVDHIAQGLDAESTQRLQDHLAPLCQVMNEMETQRQSTQQELDAARMDLSRLQSAHDVLARENTSLMEARDDAVTRAQAQEDENQRLALAQRALEGARQALEAHVQHLAANLQNTQQDRDGALARVQVQASENAQQELEIQRLNAALLSTQSELDDARREHRLARGALAAEQADHGATQRTLATAETDLRDERAAHAATQGNLLASQNDLRAEQTAHGVTRGELTAEQTAHGVTRGDLTAERTAHGVTRGDLTAERAAHTATRATLATAQTDLGDERTAHTATQRNLLASQNDLRAEQAAHTATRTALTASQARLTSVQDALTQEEDAHTMTRGVLGAAQTALQEARHALTLAQQLGAQHLARATQAQSALGGLQAQHASLSQTNALGAQQNRDLEGARGQLLRYLSSLETNLARARQELQDAKTTNGLSENEVSALRRALRGSTMQKDKRLSTQTTQKENPGHLDRLTRALSSFMGRASLTRSKRSPVAKNAQKAAPQEKGPQKEAPIMVRGA